jgi:MFS family permease
VEWELSEPQTDSIISVVFAGAMIGTLILSPLGDRWGRRPVFTLTAAIIAVFGLGTALVPNNEWLLVVRFLVGFGVGGLTVPFE